MMKQSGSQALIVVAGALTYSHSKRIADLALASGLPSMHGLRDTVIAGGLVASRSFVRQDVKLTKSLREYTQPIFP